MARQLDKTYLKKIESVIAGINKLAKGKSSVGKRIDLLMIGMSLVEMAQNEFLAYKVEVPKFDNEEIIPFDWQLSEYAEKFYKQASYITEVLAKNGENKITELLMSKGVAFLDLTKKMMNISARWHCERWINVFEFETPPKERSFPKRKPLLEECIFFADRMIGTKMGIKYEDKIQPRRIIFAVQPSSGKSLVVNVWSCISLCLHHIYYKTSGILRMSNNGTNAEGFSGQIQGMMGDIKIVDIYPEYKNYFTAGTVKPKIFEKTPLSEWKMADLNAKIVASFFARGRDSAINSIRINVGLSIDDLSDGTDQMNDDEAHKKMTTKYYLDMDSRKDSEDLPEFIVGTMFNENDVQNTLIREEEDKGTLIQDKNFKNVRRTMDYSTIIICVDCFDEKGESVAPNLISTEKLKAKQRALKPYEFDLVYRQLRASREPRVFDWQNLQTYAMLPKTLNETAIAVLDPTRRNGNDYFALSVYRLNPEDNKYYFVNCICRQQSLGKMSDPNNKFLDLVVQFLIKMKVVDFIIENNTSNTLGTVFEEWFKKYGYLSCKIDEIYTTREKDKTSKVQRILDQEATIVNNIVFPKKDLFSPRHDVTIFMDLFTRFDSKAPAGAKNHDDPCDSVAIFSKRRLFNRTNRLAEIKGLSKSRFFR
jgi:hypothetical protein